MNRLWAFSRVLESSQRPKFSAYRCGEANRIPYCSTPGAKQHLGVQEEKDERYERLSAASEQTRVPPRLPSLDEHYPRGARSPRADATSRWHDNNARRPRRGDSRTLRIAPADCRRRAVATVRLTGHTVDRRSRVPGRATSSGSPARARGGVQNDQRGVGGDVDPTRARLPLPRGGRDQPRNARESRTRAGQAGARRARLASIPREGPQPGRHDGRPSRDQQPGAAARRRDARRTPKSLARSPDVR